MNPYNQGIPWTIGTALHIYCKENKLFIPIPGNFFSFQKLHVFWWRWWPRYCWRTLKIKTITYPRKFAANCTSSDLDITSWLKSTRQRRKLLYSSLFFRAFFTWRYEVNKWLKLHVLLNRTNCQNLTWQWHFYLQSLHCSFHTPKTKAKSKVLYQFLHNNVELLLLFNIFKADGQYIDMHLSKFFHYLFKERKFWQGSNLLCFCEGDIFDCTSWFLLSQNINRNAKKDQGMAMEHQ